MEAYVVAEKYAFVEAIAVTDIVAEEEDVDVDGAVAIAVNEE